MKRAARLCRWLALALTLAGRGDGIHAGRLEIVARGHVFWTSPIQDEEAFEVAYIHSREFSVWVQHFRAEPDGLIRQTGSTFQAFGAGMPLGSAPAALGRDGLTVTVDSRLADIRLMNWRLSQIELRYRGQHVAVGQWFEDFEPFQIRLSLARSQ